MIFSIHISFIPFDQNNRSCFKDEVVNANRWSMHFAGHTAFNKNTTRKSLDVDSGNLNYKMN